MSASAAVAEAPTAGPVERFLEAHAARAASLPGHGTPWLDRLRGGAIARFAEIGFPGPREEYWKYTRTAPIEKRSFTAPADHALDLAALEPVLLPGLAGRRLVFVNGRFSEALSDPGPEQAGVTVASLARMLAQAPERVEPWLARHLDVHRHAFLALGAAFLEDGAFIHVARNTQVEEPIQLIYVSTEAGGEFAAHPRNLVVGESGSAARVVETWVSAGGRVYLNNTATEVVLEDNARVDHYKVQEEGFDGFHVATLQVHQGRDSRFATHAVSFGGRLVRNDVNAVLDGEGAECLLSGLYMGDGRQHVDFHVTVDHAQPHCTSRELYKGILGGRARGVFNGRVHVHPDAQKTDSEQSNKNLLLSKNAEVDTKPELEIYADDVKCSHGATVGQLDDAMLFYLRSRGIDREAARGLLTYGFAQDVINRIDLEPLRAHLEGILVTRVPEAERVQEIV
jgi:Fe-S cluster assembly protein SufD